MTRIPQHRLPSNGPARGLHLGRSRLFAIPNLTKVSGKSNPRAAAGEADEDPDVELAIGPVQHLGPAAQLGPAASPQPKPRSHGAADDRVAPDSAAAALGSGDRESGPLTERTAESVVASVRAISLRTLARSASSTWRRKTISGVVSIVLGYSLLANLPSPKSAPVPHGGPARAKTPVAGWQIEAEPLGPLRMATSVGKSSAAVASASSDDVIFQVPRLHPQAASNDGPSRPPSASPVAQRSSFRGPPLQDVDLTRRGEDSEPSRAPRTAVARPATVANSVVRSGEPEAYDDGRIAPRRSELEPAATTPVAGQSRLGPPTQYETTDPGRFRDPEYDFSEIAGRRASAKR